MKINQEKLTQTQQSISLKLGQLSNLAQIHEDKNKKNIFETNHNNTKNSTINDALKNLFTEVLEKQTSKKILLSAAKNTPIFKTFEHFGTEIKKLIELVEAQNTKPFDISHLKSLLFDPIALDEKTLKNALEKTIFSNETKNILSGFLEYDKEEVRNLASKMISQIEYFQLTSYLNNSLYTYLPFEWSEFEGGDIEFKNDEQKQYSCHINLSLKEYGSLKINMYYDETNHINLGFFIESELLKDKISLKLQELRKSLKNVGVIIQSISLIAQIEEKSDDKLLAFEHDKLFNNNCFDVMA